MDLDQWLTLIISLVLSGVGIFMAHKSDVLLTKVEEQNRHFDQAMTQFVDRLIRTQTELLTIAIMGRTSDSSQEEDLVKQIERLKQAIISNTGEK